VSAHAFPPTIYVALRPDDDESEALDCAFAPEDLEGQGPIAVYELKSIGQMERRFVPALEQRRDASA
jgi:hypothetical protein